MPGAGAIHPICFRPKPTIRVRPEAVLRLNPRVVRSRLLDPTGGAVSRIFLSYARDDVDAAKHLAEGISRAGHDVWWDRNLHGGSPLHTGIEQTLPRALALPLRWWEAYLVCPAVKGEAGR